MLCVLATVDNKIRKLNLIKSHQCLEIILLNRSEAD